MQSGQPSSEVAPTEAASGASTSSPTIDVEAAAAENGAPLDSGQKPTSPMLSCSFSPVLQQQQQQPHQLQALHTGRSRPTRTPRQQPGNGNGSSNDNGSGGVSQDYVNVVVRLKPPQARTTDAYMAYSIEPGSLHTPRTGRRSPGTNQVTPRTERGGVMDSSARSTASDSGSARAPRPPKGPGAPTQPSGSPHAASASGSTFAPGATGTVLTLTCPPKASSSPPSGAEERRAYEFGEVLAPNVSDEDMCKRLVPGILEQMAAGYNTCVLCYGQTGSGKTHTITTLVPFLTNAVFNALDPENDVVELSYIQIYNNAAYDLLGKATDREAFGVPLPRPTGVAVCEPKVLARTPAAVLSKVAVGQKLRCTSTHRLNARSSRSHTLLSLHVTRCVSGLPITTTKVTLADLAGSERVKRSGAQGDELTEAISINKSLHALHSLIIAAVADSDVLPYRESLLTRYLAPRLREWNIILIVTASLEKSNAAETKSSLEFASTAKRCIVLKKRACTTDRVGGTGAAHLVGDLEELRDRLQLSVAALQRRVADLQAQCKDLLAARDREESDVAVAKELEAKIASYQSLQQAREEELLALRADAEQQRWQQAQLLDESATEEAARQRSRALLEQLREQLPSSPPPHDDPKGDAVTEDDLVGSVREAFLWTQAQLDAVSEQYRVLDQAAAGLRGDNSRLQAEVQELRRELASRDALLRECEAAAQATTEAAARRQRAAEDRHAGFFLALTDRAVRVEMAELYGTPAGQQGLQSGSSATGLFATGLLRRGHTDASPSEDGEAAVAQRDLVVDYTSELEAKERSLLELRKELAQYRELLIHFWRSAAPAQKGQLLGGSGGTGANGGSHGGSYGGGGGHNISNSGSLPSSPGSFSAASTRGCMGSSMTGNGVPVADLSASGRGGALAQGIRVAQLRTRLQEVELEAASLLARESDVAKESEEQRRQIADLRGKMAKMAEQVVGFCALKNSYLQAIEKGEGERAELVKLVDRKEGHIARLGKELDLLKHQFDGLQTINVDLERKNATVTRRLEDLAEEKKRVVQDMQARAAAADEVHRSVVHRLEWRHAQLSEGYPAAANTSGTTPRGSTALLPIHSTAATLHTYSPGLSPLSTQLFSPLSRAMIEAAPAPRSAAGLASGNAVVSAPVASIVTVNGPRARALSGGKKADRQPAWLPKRELPQPASRSHSLLEDSNGTVGPAESATTSRAAASPPHAAKEKRTASRKAAKATKFDSLTTTPSATTTSRTKKKVKSDGA